jgi:hypothetical protein
VKRPILVALALVAACKGGDKAAPAPGSGSAPVAGSGSGSAVAAAPADAAAPGGAPLDERYVNAADKPIDLGDGYALYGGFDGEPAPDTLELVVAKGTTVHSRVKGLATIAPGLAVPEGSYDNYVAALQKEDFGVRVGLGLQSGEDMFSAQELAVLYQVPSPITPVDTWKPLWAGPGTSYRSEMDECKESVSVTFAIDGQTLVKTSETGCGKRTKKTVERFPLPTLATP